MIHWGSWKVTGDLTTIDLIAATTNALNGAILARRPDHYRNFTIVGEGQLFREACSSS